MSDSELRATANLAPGRVVVSSMSQIDLLASTVEHRTQGVVICVTDVNAPILTVVGTRRRVDSVSTQPNWTAPSGATGREAVESYWFAL